MLFTGNEGPDQTAHLRSLIWSFVARFQNHRILPSISTDKESPKEVYISLLISAQDMVCGYSLEPPRRGGSNDCPQCVFWAEIEIEKISDFLSENFHFLVVKFSIYLNRRVFVM